MFTCAAPPWSNLDTASLRIWLLIGANPAEGRDLDQSGNDPNILIRRTSNCPDPIQRHRHQLFLTKVNSLSFYLIKIVTVDFNPLSTDVSNPVFMHTATYSKTSQP